MLLNRFDYVYVSIFLSVATMFSYTCRNVGNKRLKKTMAILISQLRAELEFHRDGEH